MRGLIGNTDYDWYRFLAPQPGIDEANLWRPSASASFRAIQPGEPFFLRLESPHN